MIATGEPAVCMSIVVLFALRYALDSARNDAGVTEKWFKLGEYPVLYMCFTENFFAALILLWSKIAQM